MQGYEIKKLVQESVDTLASAVLEHARVEGVARREAASTQAKALSEVAKALDNVAAGLAYLANNGR
jgi:hypothetical protein